MSHSCYRGVGTNPTASRPIIWLIMQFVSLLPFQTPEKDRDTNFTKMTNLLFESPFVGFSGNVGTSLIARWKVHSRLPIRDN